MQKKKVWTMAALTAAPIGGVIGRLQLIGPNPETYFVLGILAAVSIFGVVYGLREGQRVARSKEPVGG